MTKVSAFDVLKDRCAGFVADWVTSVNALGLESSKKALHHGIVVAVATAAHADLNAFARKQFLVVAARVLTALVGVVEQSCFRTAARPWLPLLRIKVVYIWIRESGNAGS